MISAGLAAPLDRIVRPFVILDSRPAQPAEVAATDLGALTPVVVEWGQASRFEAPARTEPRVYEVPSEDSGAGVSFDPPGEDTASGPTYTFTAGPIPPGDFFDEDDEEEADEGEGEGDEDASEEARADFVFSEIARAVRVVRVENPEDENQWVEVEVIDRIQFRGRDGLVYEYRLNNRQGT